ncbi:MAG: type II toxin-antitoxin system RelE/ParE family toxin [Nitrospirales bacterium]
MAQRLIWSPAARLDLHDLRTYIAESDPAAPKRFIPAIFDAKQRIIDFPESGRMVPEFQDPNLRKIIKRP